MRGAARRAGFVPCAPREQGPGRHSPCPYSCTPGPPGPVLRSWEAGGEGKGFPDPCLQRAEWGRRWDTGVLSKVGQLLPRAKLCTLSH